MDKKLLFTLLGAGFISAQALAQTDVTDTYLKNAGFDTESDWQTGNVATSKSTNAIAVSEWTSNGGASWSSSAAFGIGGTGQINGAAVPSTNSDGGTTGGVLGLSVGWSGASSYTQTVTLPKGSYVLSYAAYNAHTATQAKNLIGAVVGGTTYYGSIDQFPNGKWVKDNVYFDVTEESASVTISVGIQAASGGSKDNAKLFVDYVKLATIDDATRTAYTEKYNTVKANYTTDATSFLGEVSNWSGSMVTNKGEHWSGNTATTYWEQTGSQWGSSSWDVNKSTSVKLPVGKYALLVAARASTNVEGYVKVNETSVALAAKGNKGKGIDTDGNATYAYDATYANTNGYGWEWSVVEFEVTDATAENTISFGGSTSLAHQWISVADITLLTQADVEKEAAKAALKTVIESVASLNTTANVGDKAFQIPTSAVSTLTAAVSAASTLYNSTTATTDEINAGTETLKAAIEAYNNAELNKPAEGDVFNLVLNGNDSYKYDGKAVTMKDGNTNAGGFGMGYTEDPGSIYNQSFTLIPVDGQLNQYYLTFSSVDGTTEYVCGGSLYKGWDAQLRATTDASKALAIKVIPTITDGIYNLYNMSTNSLISSTDAGFYTAGTNGKPNFNIVKAAKHSATLKVTDSKWATFVAPFAVAVPDGVKAYTTSSLDGDNLVLTEVEGEIAACTPVVLYSEKAVNETVEGYALATKTAYTTGLLTGSLVEMSVVDGNYVLQNHDGAVAFYVVDSESAKVTLPAYKAYLTAPADDNNIKALHFVVSDPTAINGVDAADADAVETARYNAAGVKVSAPVKGLNIVKYSNGKTVKQIIK